MTEADEFSHALAGAGGGALSMMVTYPLVTLSTHAQTKSKQASESSDGDAELDETTEKKNVSTFETAKKIIDKNGVSGLYAGLESAIYGITITNFIYYYFYEFTTKSFLRKKKNKGLSTIESMISGAIAGSITCILSNPLWVANTRMTVANSKRGTIGTIIDIIKRDGVPALFSGVVPALVLVLNPIIQYSVFEQMKNALAKRGRKTTPLLAFFLGAFGKLIATGSTYPYITLKARMHIAKEKSSMLQLINQIWAKEGVSGFYNGVSVKLVQSIWTAAFLFYFKEELLIGSVKISKLLKSLKK